MENPETPVRILVVDDEPDIRNILHILLSSRGYEVDEAENGLRAVELVRAQPDYDLIILDIMMPGMDGVSACAEIRRHSVAPILFLTAKAQPADMSDAYGSGGDDYLIKPFSNHELFLRVDSLIRRYRVYHGKGDAPTVIDALEINRDKGTVCKNGRSVEMTKTEFELLQYLIANRGAAVSSRDTLAIEQWSRGEKKANVIVYQAEGDPYEAGSWGTSELLDDTTQSDIADLGYSFFTLQFADGEYRVAVCDYSEAWLYSYVRFGALVLGFVIYSFIAFGFTRRLTRRVTRLSEAVGAAGALNRTIPVTGTDEIARLAASVNTMRDTILERTRNEQTAWQANSDLITALSHDIRNPLTSLIGYLDLLEMSQDRLPEDLRSYVLASRDKAYQLKDLTGEMFRYFLVFSRGEQETHPEPYDAQILCAQLLGECAAELRSRGFDVNLLLLTTPCTVTTDVQMLKRVTDNLLSNIEKYADPAARLTILAECEGERLHVCFANRARRELARVESNHIGLRTCEAILQLLGGQFFTHRTGDDFSAEFVLPRTPPDAAQG